MTDYLIKTDGTSSGLTLGSAIADTDAFEVQQAFVAPASTLHQTFAAIKTWIKAWIVKGDVGLGNVSNNAQLTIANNLSDLNSAIAARLNLGVTTKFVAGRYYWPPDLLLGSAAVTSANRITLFPFRAPYTGTLSEFFTRIQAGSAGNFQCALYAADATTLLPTGTALATSSASGSTLTGSTNVSTTLTSNYQIQEGLVYWLALNCDNATATIANVLGSSGYCGSLIGDATLANMTSGSNASFIGLFIAQTFGTWPDLTGGSFTRATSAIPAVGFKVTSVP